MASILIIGPDPETREILKLRFEVDGVSVLTALGSGDALPQIKSKKPDAVIVDLVDYDSGEMKEVSAIVKATKNTKTGLALLWPRGGVESPPKTDLIVRKPYDLNVLAKQMGKLISSPKTSCSSRRGSRRRS